MKITHHLGRFSAFFKESSLFVQLAIVASGISIVAGTATVAAMVANPSDNKSSQTVASSEVESSNTESSPNSSQPTTNEEQQPDNPTPAQPNQTTNTPQSSGNSNQPAQQEPQPEPKPEPTYTDTYPAAWKNECGAIDSWAMSKCYSSSYTAYKVAELGIFMPKWGMSDANGNGDPKNWPAKADAANIPRGTTPKVNSVGIQTSGPAGWSVWVEAVNGDKITISYYNFGNNLKYGLQKNVPASSFSTYIYFGPQ